MEEPPIDDAFSYGMDGIDGNGDAAFQSPFVSAMALINNHPEERAYVVEGIIRQQEVGALIAGSKAFKTSTILALAASIAVGRMWLGTFQTRQSRVLYIDNEMNPETLARRLRAIASALGIERSELNDTFHVWSLRGQLKDIYSFDADFRRFPVGHYGLIVFDSLYKALPKDCDENSNTAMGAVFNKLDFYAKLTGAAILIVHHQPKGDMSGRDVIDMGSGAGAIGRAVDTMLVLRRHQDTDCAVLQCKTRTSKEPDPLALRFIYPVWTYDGSLDASQVYKPGKARPSSVELPAVDPVREAEVARAKVDSDISAFISQFINSEPRAKKDILADAVVKGHMKKSVAENLLLVAQNSGKIHLWQGKSTTPDRYATRAPELIDLTQFTSEKTPKK